MSNHNRPIDLRGLCARLSLQDTPVIPASISVRLRSAVRERRKQLRRRRFFRISVGIAACLLLILSWHLRTRPQPPLRSVDVFAGFMALPYSQTDVPIEQAVIVHVNVRRTDLEQLGLPHALIVGKQRMPADLLIGQDGVARAVRLRKDD